MKASIAIMIPGRLTAMSYRDTHIAVDCRGLVRANNGIANCLTHVRHRVIVYRMKRGVIHADSVADSDDRILVARLSVDSVAAAFQTRGRIFDLSSRSFVSEALSPALHPPLEPAERRGYILHRGLRAAAVARVDVLQTHDNATRVQRVDDRRHNGHVCAKGHLQCRRCMIARDAKPR
jgi:hypothetical protein